MESKKNNKTQKNINADMNAELLADLQRTRADFENFKKQTDLQKAQAKKIAEYSTVLKIIPLIDDIFRAISANYEIMQPVEKTLQKTLAELNLAKIVTTAGTEFNPDLHDAISVDEDSVGEKEVIAEELRSGYLYNGEVLRPAMVRVKRI